MMSLSPQKVPLYIDRAIQMSTPPPFANPYLPLPLPSRSCTSSLTGYPTAVPGIIPGAGASAPPGLSRLGGRMSGEHIGRAAATSNHGSNNSNNNNDNNNSKNDNDSTGNNWSNNHNTTLQTHLKALSKEDPHCVFIVRKVNRLGFRSGEILTRHFSSFGGVVKVLVAHPKVKRAGKGNELHLRPGSLGFVVMKTAGSVEKVLSLGPEVLVQGLAIRVQPFQRVPYSGDELGSWGGE